MDKKLIDGVYPNGIINTTLGWITVNEYRFFAQCKFGENIISEIFEIFKNENLTPERSFNKWIENNHKLLLRR